MKAVFLDRDGVINVDHGFISTRSEWEWAPGALEGLKLFQDAGYALMVVTNQTGIGLGYYNEEDVRLLHQYMREEAAKHDIEFTAVAYCPHKRDAGCNCRKPAIGMAISIEKAVRENIDYPQSWTVGDKLTDMEFGHRLGMKTALVPSRYWNKGDSMKHVTVVVDDLAHAARYAMGIQHCL